MGLQKQKILIGALAAWTLQGCGGISEKNFIGAKVAQAELDHQKSPESLNIVNGIPNNGSLPAVGAILKRFESEPQAYYVHCTATLIDKQWLLTAAHCVKDEDIKQIYFSNNLPGAIPYSNYYFYVVLDRDRPQKIFDIIEKKIDPSGRDVALIKISRPSSTPPMELDYYQNTPYSNYLISGFGADKNNKYGLLQRADVAADAVQSNPETWTITANSRAQVCSRDSGSALLRLSDGKISAVGVIIQVLFTRGTDCSSVVESYAVNIKTVESFIKSVVSGGPIGEAPPMPSTSNRLDVNGDGKVTSLDALRVINYLSRSGVRAVSAQNSTYNSRYDVNEDGLVSSLDALRIINSLSKK